MNSFKNIPRCQCVESNCSQETVHITRGEVLEKLMSPLLSSKAVLPTPHRMNQKTSTKLLPTRGRATILSTAINMFNTIVGAGMLGLPYGFANAGVQMGSVWFVITGFGGAYSIHLLAKCALDEEMFSFRALAKKTLKFKGNEHFVNAMLAFNCFGNCCGYVVICGQLIPDIFRDLINPLEGSLWLSTMFWITIVVWVISLPLVCLKNLNSLKFTSTLGFVGTMYVVVLTVLYAWRNDLVGDPCEHKSSCPGEFVWGFPGDTPNLLRVIAVFCFAFVATQNVPSLTFEMKKRSIRRFDIAICGAISMSTVVYFLTALGGYVAFGDIVDADLLQSFPINTYSSIARIGIVLSLCTTIPLQMYPVKNSVCNIFFGLDAYECSSERHYGTVLLLLAACWGVGLHVKDLSVILSFLGATTAVFIGYSFPAYFYIKLYAKKGKITCDVVLSYLILAASLILSPLLIAVEIYSLIDVRSKK